MVIKILVGLILLPFAASFAFHPNVISLHLRRNSFCSMSSSQLPPKTLIKNKIEAVGNRILNDGAKVCWPNLKAFQFRHPLDSQATIAVQALLPFENMVRASMGGMLEQVVYLDNLSNGVKVSMQQLPKIYESLQDAKKVLGLEDLPVELYVRQNPVPNAYTMALQGKQPFIVVQTSLIEMLTAEELQAVIAHELGHLKCEHGIWITLANLLPAAASMFPLLGPLVADRLESSIRKWLQAAELSCDRASLLVAQDPLVVVGVIMKLTGGSRTLGKDMSAEAFLSQAREYEEASQASWVGRQMRRQLAAGLTHPLPVTRARELDAWARSDEYRRLLADGRPLRTLTPPTTPATP